MVRCYSFLFLLLPYLAFYLLCAHSVFHSVFDSPFFPQDKVSEFAQMTPASF